jgi:hypothetical protein
MVRLVDSQWLELVTLESLLVKVTSQDTAELAVTLNVVLLVVSVPEEPVPDSVFEYSCPLTAEPEVAPQLSPVKSWAVSVPVSGQLYSKTLSGTASRSGARRWPTRRLRCRWAASPGPRCLPSCR